MYRYSFFLVGIFILIFSTGQPLWNESIIKTDQITVDPWARGVVKGDLSATLEKCITSFLSNEPELPYPWDEWGCDEVAGYNFILKHTDPDGNIREIERTLGENTGRKTSLDQFPREEKYIEQHGEDIYEFVDSYILAVHLWLRCVTPDITVSADKEHLGIGEETWIKVMLTCKDSVMTNETIRFSLIGPGKVEPKEIETDQLGTAKATYYASEAGAAVVSASYIHSTGKCKNETDSVSVLVGDFAVASVTGKETVTEIGERTHSAGSSITTKKRNYRSEIEAKVYLILELTQTLLMPMYNEVYEYYDIKEIHLTSFRANLRDWEYERSKDQNGWGELTETWNGHDYNANIKRPAHYRQLGLGQVIVVFDTKSKKAKAVNNLGGWVNYTFKRDFTQEGQGVNKIGPFHWTHTDSSEDEKVFSIEPVGEKKTNIPRISLLTFPEYLVTSGDGIKYMAGSGKVTTDDCSHHNRDYTTCKTEKTFRWEFKRSKKNQKS